VPSLCLHPCLLALLFVEACSDGEGRCRDDRSTVQRKAHRSPDHLHAMQFRVVPTVQVGQCWHQRAKLARPELVIGAVWPARHLTVRACRSIRKSWMVNPPGTALCSGRP
jgi:hypothetical protein